MSQAFSAATRSVFRSPRGVTKDPTCGRWGDATRGDSFDSGIGEGYTRARASEIALGYQYFHIAIRAVLPATSVKRKSRPSKGQVRVFARAVAGAQLGAGFCGPN